jgi:hypothetical protein
MSFAASTNPVVSTLGGGRDTQAADQGQYFVAITPTPGTGIVGTASVQAFTETTPVFICYNSGTLNIYPMSLRTHLTVVGATASVAENMTFTLDVGNRFSSISVGTALTVNNLNSGSTNASGAVIYAGGVVATAATGARRVVGHVQKKHTVIEVVHDTTTYMWGGTNAVSFSSTVANTTTPTYSAHNLPPVVIAPGYSMVIVEWAGAQTTGSTNEYMFSYIEK